LTLRVRLSLILSALLALSIGVTGAVLIYESWSHARQEVTAKQQLFAATRAFALRDNFEILEGELERLSLLPQIDFNDDDPQPEAELLENAHRNSVLYNTAVLLLSASGECVRSVPDRPEFRSQKFGDRPWFRAAAEAQHGPAFRVTDEPLIGRTLKIIQPIQRKRRFAGALVGLIALDQENLLTSALANAPLAGMEAVLVDSTGHVIYPPDRYMAAPSSDWSRAIDHAAKGETGTVSGYAAGEESLFAFAPVEASTGFAVVFRWPWWQLNQELRHQVVALLGILVFGVVFAGVAGLLLSVLLTRPLESLAEKARRIERGEPAPRDQTSRPRSDELGALERTFDQMERAIQRRDLALREGAALLEERVADRTRELKAAQEALVETERFAAMGKTSAAIAHEVKNTLNGLGMAVELILADPANAQRVGRLRTQVVAEITRLRDVIDSLLSFSASPRITQAKEDLTQVARRALDLLGSAIADRGAEVTIDAPPELELYCDGHKIQGVVLNLVKNAVEAGHRVHVQVCAPAPGEEAVVEVADDGPGLSDEARAHLFEPFFTTKPNGTGLGLPTSLRFVEAHGGSLEVGASVAGGALFRVRLPRGGTGPAEARPQGGAA
jgi:signal transduction histidine kinase